MDGDGGPGPEPVTAAGPSPAPELPPEADPDVEPLPRGGFRCRLCQVAAANRPSLAEHLRGKKHQRLQSLRAERRAQEQRSLFVSGFARGTAAEELAAYFGAFGEVVAVVMDKEKGAYAIVELREAASRERALAQPQHALAGRSLRVRPREQKDFARPSPGRGAHREPLGAGQLERALCQANDVDAQMEQLVGLLELSEGERRLRHLLVALFQEVFSEFFPSCSVLPFGSSVNGFDAHGCDLDLLLDLEPTKSLQSSARGSPGAEESILSDIDLASASPPELLELVAAVLRRCVPGVRRVHAVPTARRPVVKFSHKQSGLAGDISVDNRLALHNTRFLRLCGEADERVRPLGYAVRLWAKQQGLAGNPAGGGPLLTNYALTLLVLFFLQTRSPPVLPAVAQLRELAGDEDRVVVAGWDCSFPRDAALLEPSANSESPSSLLAEFFRVFGDFDFSGQVLSLREGRALPLPEAGELFKQGSLNLQDPFELSHNVAANVTEKTAARLGHCCRAAAKYCRSLQYRCKSTKGRGWGLARLFQPGAVEPGAGAASFLISIPVPAPWCPEEPGGGFKEICAGIAFVLRDVLRCSCTPGKPPKQLGAPRAGQSLPQDPVGGKEPPGDTAGVEEEPLQPPTASKRPQPDGTDGAAPPRAKRPRVNGPEQEEEEDEEEEEVVASWSCTVWHHVWTGRRRLRRQLLHGASPEEPEEGGDSLELEQKVSEAIVQHEGAARPPEPLLRFEASARLAGGGRREPRVLLRLTPSPAPGPLFRDFFHFLQAFRPPALRRRLGWGPGAAPQS